MKIYCLFAILLLSCGFICGCIQQEKNPTQTPLSSATVIPTNAPSPTPTLELIQSADLSLLLDKQYYATVDQINPETWEREFWQSYTDALDSKDDWVKNPVTIALRYGGYPNVDYRYPDSVTEYLISDSEVVIVATNEHLRTDSVFAVEYRIDFLKNGDVWKIEWAGNRYRCVRTTSSEWTTNLCP
jgi:hypothetical protein